MRPIWIALTAAALFGLSVPAVKVLIEAADPWLVAGLLYAASGLSLGSLRVARSAFRRQTEASISRRDWPGLGAGVVAGGVVAPVLLVFGLASGSATQAALLLNLEGVFTTLVAWAVFREHVDRRIAAGMVAIALGALVLAWDPSLQYRFDASGVLIALACLAWAADNNFTRHVSASDPLEIAALKGLAAGVVNIAIAVVRGTNVPGAATVATTMAIGVIGYGLSLVLYVFALRHLGAARTGAYFSTAPFLGALGGILGLGEPITPSVVAAALLMGTGIWLHLSERHQHEHLHASLTHEHSHRHDDHHHQHSHGVAAPDGESHSHWHVHAPLRHRHPHYPDIHHRHAHQ